MSLLQQKVSPTYVSRACLRGRFGWQVSVERRDRARHGTSHGLSDIWALRSGQLPRAPDAVVWPTSEEQVPYDTVPPTKSILVWCLGRIWEPVASRIATWKSDGATRNDVAPSSWLSASRGWLRILAFLSFFPIFHLRARNQCRRSLASFEFQKRKILSNPHGSTTEKKDSRPLFEPE